MGSIIGIAYLDVMCESTPGDAWNGKYEYGISQATQSSLGCNVGLVMHELGHNAGSGHVSGAVMNPWPTCSNTFHPLAIGQIEDHMDGHVPNDGRMDGCWCEKMFYWPGGWPWWWKFPWLASKRRGAVHLLTGKDIDGSIIGIAYLDVMCESTPADKYGGKYEYG